MTMHRPELKPCPFCGASCQHVTKEVLASGTSIYYVKCRCCEACGPQSNKEGYAASEWNERSENDGNR